MSPPRRSVRRREGRRRRRPADALDRRTRTADPVSYFEWVQANQAYWWRADEVETRLEERMLGAWTHVTGYAESRALSLRTAATMLAVERVADAHRTRGLYP